MNWSKSISTLIEDIYDAAQDASKWQEVISSIVDVSQSKSGCLLSMDHNFERANIAIFSGIDPDWISAYHEHYHQFDPTFDVFGAANGQAIPDHVTGPNKRKLSGVRKHFYHEFMVPQEYAHTTGCSLFSNQHQQAALILQRNQQQGGYEKQHLQLIDTLSPHLRRALQLHWQLSRSNAHQRGLENAFDLLPHGVILLDELAQPAFISHKAETILANYPCLKLSRHSITAANSEQADELEAFISQAVLSARGKGAYPGAAMRVYNRQGQSVQIVVTPFKVNRIEASLSGKNLCAAIFIASPKTKSQLSNILVQQLYSLTKAETRLLCHLCEGSTIAEIAKSCCISQNTVRSQLKSIMAKTRVKRQAELIRMVMAGPASFL